MVYSKPTSDEASYNNHPSKYDWKKINVVKLRVCLSLALGCQDVSALRVHFLEQTQKLSSLIAMVIIMPKLLIHIKGNPKSRSAITHGEKKGRETNSKKGAMHMREKKSSYV